MVGGPGRGVFNTMKPLFEKMGKNITLVGGQWRWPDSKVANQIIVALTIAAVGEALLFVEGGCRSGAGTASPDGRLCFFANSRSPRRTHGEAKLGARGFGSNCIRKLNLALEGARALGLSLPNTSMAQQLFNSCSAHGGKAWDHSGLVRVLEHLAGHTVAKG